MADISIATTSTSNAYFYAASALPLQAPDFSKFTEDDFPAAFERGMERHRGEIDAILSDPSPASFDNTVVAIEKAGQELGRVSTLFEALTSAHTTPRLDEIETEYGPKLSSHHDAITLDPKLFERVRSVKESFATEDVEDAMLLKRTFDGMVHAGAELSDAERKRVKGINTELSRLTTEFSQKVRAAMSGQPLIVDTREELAGLPESEIKAAEKLAAEKNHPGKFALALQNTTQQPLLPSIASRELRERLFERSFHRGDGTNADHDTRMLVAQIASLRAEKASIFGKCDWATYTLWDTMVDSPKEAIEFMTRMVPALATAQRKDAEIFGERAKADGADGSIVRPWDWFKFAEEERKAKYELDEAEIAKYFQLDRVLEDGVFFAAEKLYGLGFKRRDDLPTYHPDVWTYTVFDHDGSELGLFYFDPFQRPSKRGGAWMGNFIDQSHLFGAKPVVYNVLNVPKAPEGETQLVSFENVGTMFHEFGHALHGLLANQKYASLSGTEVARDFVEFPSQVNEMWATHPDILANYAKHYQTGETIPGSLVTKIEAVSKFNQGYEFGEVVEAALLDMKWHALSRTEAEAMSSPVDVDAFETKALEELGLQIDLVPPRYRSTYFDHIFSSPVGYSAGYYSYLWTEMLDRDARKLFLTKGGATRENGDHFRATVLSRGATEDYAKMFRDFAGRDPDVNPMLEARGLI